ncbi:MAG: glycosyltransferase family 4 protein [Acidipila sp.]|nr:glycosyltransferase family 4 protein [Acidipila sp.]
MRIGIDATCWSNRRGYGRFVRALLTAALEIDRVNQYVFFLDDASAEFPPPAGVEVIRVKASVPTIQAAAADGSRSVLDMWAMSRAISACPLDIFFFPSVYSFVPLFSRVPRLVAIHDVIPELFPELVFPSVRAKLFWRAKVKLACTQATRVLTVSEYSRQRLAEVLKLDPAEIRVVPEAGAPQFRRMDSIDDAALALRLKIPAGSRMLVYVGGFSPHKNLPMLVDVFSALAAQPQFSDVRLILVGDFEGDVFHSGYAELKSQVSRLGLEERVIFSGYLGDEHLVPLLNRATALVLPSFCEGFGLPAMEAAACGTPSVITTRSPLPELLGEGAIALEPDDRAGWQAALARILSDPALRERMSVAALAAAHALSWQASARQLLAIFDEVRR